MIIKEDILNSKSLWSDYFYFTLYKVNPDGTEWWQIVNNPQHFDRVNLVSCSSELMCHKICLTAFEMMLKRDISVNHSIVKRKAKELLYSIKEEERHLIKIKNIRKHEIIQEKIKEKKKILKENRERKIQIRKFLCPTHGIMEIEFHELEPDITECIRCSNSIQRIY